MTIGEVYNPLVQAATSQDPQGYVLLEQTGRMIFTANPGRCPSVEDGIEAARRNLDYYCQYFDDVTQRTVKDFYQLGQGFRGLNGKKSEGII